MRVLTLIVASMALNCVSARLNAAIQGSIELSVSPSVVQRSGDNFTVSWSGNTAPSSGDWMGVWIGGYPNGKYFVSCRNSFE